MILATLAIISFFFACLLLHELGHKLEAERLGYDAECYIFRDEDGRFDWLSFHTVIYGDFSKSDERNIMLAGILYGGVPLFILSLFLPLFAGVFLLVAYLIGCKSDISHLWGLGR